MARAPVMLVNPRMERHNGGRSQEHNKDKRKQKTRPSDRDYNQNHACTATGVRTEFAILNDHKGELTQRTTGNEQLPPKEKPNSMGE